MKLNNKARGAALALALLLAVPVPAHASDYDFESEDGTDYYTPTEYEDVYGAQYNYSGQNVSDFQTVEFPYGVYSNTATGAMEKVCLPGQTAAYGSLAIDYGGIHEILNVNPSAATAPQQAQPVYQKPAYTSAADMTRKGGSIGTIQIPTLGIDMKVWEGETNESMKKGIAHYSSTTAWDGNACFCAHNRGSKYSIGAIKDLKPGDLITYTTIYGTRTYEVSTVEVISSTDWSRLQGTADNRITITTCLADQPTKRVVVQGIAK